MDSGDTREYPLISDNLYLMTIEMIKTLGNHEHTIRNVCDILSIVMPSFFDIIIVMYIDVSHPSFVSKY